MAPKNKKLHDWGVTLSCLGGLILILSMDQSDDSKWGLALSILAVVLALLGIYLINKARSMEKKK